MHKDNDRVTKLGLEEATKVSRPVSLASGPLGTMTRRGSGPGLAEAEGVQSRGEDGSVPRRCTRQGSLRPPPQPEGWLIPVLGGADEGASGSQKAGHSG